jgi:ATP-dependent DNA helicase RecG
MGENGFAYEVNIQLDALREGLVNMLMHADYFSVMHSAVRVFSNRIVFQNPGRFDINILEWHKTAISKPRNPVIARIFRWAKLAENAGFGYDKMLAWKYKVEFDTNIDYSEATFFLSEKSADTQQNFKSKKTVEKTVEKIIEAITNNPLITQGELSELTGLTRRGIEYNLSKLKEKGLIERIGPDKGGYWKILTEKN